MRKRRRDMVVVVRGVRYADAYAAAEALGVKPQSVYSAVAKGRADALGLGKGGRKSQQGGGVVPKPIVVAGIRFESRAELARAIGREPHNLRTALKRGGESHQRIIRDVMKMIIAARENKALKELKN